MLQTQLESQKNQTWNAINQTWLVIGIFSAILIAWGLFQHFDIRKQSEQLRRDFDIDQTQTRLNQALEAVTVQAREITKMTDENYKSRVALSNTVISLFVTLIYREGNNSATVYPLAGYFSEFVFDNFEFIIEDREIHNRVISLTASIAKIFATSGDIYFDHIVNLSKKLLETYKSSDVESNKEKDSQSDIDYLDWFVKNGSNTK